MKRNIELKARCADLSAARQRAIGIGAERQGVLVQTDTYFHSPRGRLKLREIAGERAELIWYGRVDATEARLSEYIVAALADAAPVLAALASALGVRVTVRKRRELLLWHNVRIHLDDVEGLGSFVELEAVLESGEDPAASHERVARLIAALGLRPEDRVAKSYGEMAGGKKDSPEG